MAAINDPLYYMEIDIKVLKHVLNRPHDETIPLGPQITDDDYRAVLREYFAEEDVDEEFIDGALADVRLNEQEEAQIREVCDTLMGGMLGGFAGAFFGSR